MGVEDAEDATDGAAVTGTDESSAAILEWFTFLPVPADSAALASDDLRETEREAFGGKRASGRGT